MNAFINYFRTASFFNVKPVIIALLSIFVVSQTACDGASADAKTGEAENSSKEGLTWQIVHTDSIMEQITFRIVLNKRTNDKAQLIEIARKLKEERSWTEKLVVFYEIKVHSEGVAWASVGYLPNCETCSTDTDSDGTDVEFRLIGMTPELADSLKVLQMDSLPNKKPIASYLDDMARCKTVLYEVPGEPGKVLRAMLFNGGGNLVDWMPIKIIDGQTRYYVPEEDDDLYVLLDTAQKQVFYKHANGKTSLTFAME